MAIEPLQTLEVIEALENFCARIRPPAHILPLLDIGYKVENQSVIVFEIRPRHNKSNEKMESLVAKTTFVKAKNHWKIFWRRADLKWHIYTPNENVKTIDEFIKLVEEDKYHCFWG